MTIAELEQRIEAVGRMIEKRAGQAGWAANVKACETELKALEAELASRTA